MTTTKMMMTVGIIQRDDDKDDNISLVYKLIYDIVILMSENNHDFDDW